MKYKHDRKNYSLHKIPDSQNKDYIEVFHALKNKKGGKLGYLEVHSNHAKKRKIFGGWYIVVGGLIESTIKAISLFHGSLNIW